MLARCGALLVLLAVLNVTPIEAASRYRYGGRIASDQGGLLRITTTLRRVTADTFAGTIRCRAVGPFQCISPTGGITVTFSPAGFDAVLTFVGGLRCVAIGTGRPGTALVGEYGCELEGLIADSGLFRLNRKR